MVLEEDGTDGDGIPADAVVVEGDVEGGGSGGGIGGGGACWKEIIAWLCRSGAGSIGIGGRREEGAAAAAAEASETDEISLHSIEEDINGLTRSSSEGGRGGGGGGTGTGTALVRMPCCGGGRITPLLLTRTCASTVMGAAADPGSVLESLWQSETLPSAALLRTDCCCRTGGGGGGARR